MGVSKSTMVRLCMLALLLATVSATSIEPADRIVPEAAEVELSELESSSRDDSNHATAGKPTIRFEHELISTGVSSGSAATPTPTPTPSADSGSGGSGSDDGYVTSPTPTPTPSADSGSGDGVDTSPTAIPTAAP